MPKIVDYALPPGGTIVDVADNNATALDIEQAGADYITVDTTNGSEQVIIGKLLTLEGGMAFSGATTFAIPDNLENAFLVENATGGADFISCDTRDGAEQLILGGGINTIVVGSSGTTTLQSPSGSHLKVGTTGAQDLSLITSDNTQLYIASDGVLSTGGETTSLGDSRGSLHILTGPDDSGGDVESSFDDLIVEKGAGCGMTLLASNTANQSLGIAFRRAAPGGNSHLIQSYKDPSSYHHLQFRCMQSAVTAEGIAATMFFSPIGDLKTLTLGGGANPVVDIKGNATKALTGTITTTGSSATVEGAGGAAFTTELKIGSTLQWTNNASGAELHTVIGITDADTLTLDATPGASTAKQAYTDPKLLHVQTNDTKAKLVVDNGGRVGINVATPDANLHVAGPGGENDLSALANPENFSALFDNGSASSADRNIVGITTSESGGAILNLYSDTTEVASLFAYTAGAYLRSTTGSLNLRCDAASQEMVFYTNGGSIARRMTIGANGSVAVGTVASNINKDFEVNNGSSYYSFDIGGTDTYVVSNSLNVKHYGGGDANHALLLNKYGALARWSLGSTDAAIANDATGDVDANSAAYLADSGATLIVDFGNGGCGQVTLTANVTAIKFYNTPKLGIAQTMTVKITNDDPARTVVYSSVTISDGTPGTTRNGSLLWAGGVAPTLSTGVGDIDIVQFTSIATSDADRDIYGAVIGQNFS